MNHSGARNVTYPHYDFPSLFVVPMTLVLILIIIFAVIGNFLVIISIVRRKSMRTLTNLFLANLSIANLMNAFLTMPVALLTIIMKTWVLGKTFCYINAYLVGLTFMASIHTLMWMSVQKCISISMPFNQVFKTKKILIVVGLTWGWPLLYNLSPLFGMTKIVYKSGSSQCGPVIPSSLNQYIHSLINTLGNFCIPLVVMIVSYSIIFVKVQSHLKRMRRTSSMNVRSTFVQQKKIAVTLIIVMSVFLICWTPYIIYSVWLVLKSSTVHQLVNPVVYWCGYTNSAITPIIYALRSSSFRVSYMEILCCTKPEEFSSTISSDKRSEQSNTRHSIRSMKSSALHCSINSISAPTKVLLHESNTRPKTEN